MQKKLFLMVKLIPKEKKLAEDLIFNTHPDALAI